MARIIMAEDDPVAAHLVTALLEKEGHIVGVLTDGVDIVRLAATKRPDLLILDCGLPTKGGLTVLRELRAHGLSPAIPVLILTARSSRIDRQIAYEAGASDFLSKPVDPDRLVVAVEALLTPMRRRA